MLFHFLGQLCILFHFLGYIFHYLFLFLAMAFTLQMIAHSDELPTVEAFPVLGVPSRLYSRLYVSILLILNYVILVYLTVVPLLL